MFGERSPSTAYIAVFGARCRSAAYSGVWRAVAKHRYTRQIFELRGPKRKDSPRTAVFGEGAPNAAIRGESLNFGSRNIRNRRA